MKHNILHTATLALAAMLTMATAATAEIKQMITVAEAHDTFDGLTSVLVNGRFCKVNVLKSDDGRTAMQGRLEAMKPDAAYKIDYRTEGTTLVIDIIVSDDSFASFVGEVTVNVPAGVEVTVENTSGYVDISGLADNKLVANTVQGKITATASHGDLSLNSKGGSVTADRLSGTISTSSSSGAQKLTEVNGSLSVDSPDGEVEITGVEGTLTVATVAGRQTIANVEGTLNVRSSSGAVRISNCTGVFNIRTMAAAVNLCETTGEFHVETTKGGIMGQKRVKLTASSDFTTTEGRIQLQLLNDKEELTFMMQTESSKVGLVAKGISKKKKLQAGKGPIVVTTKTRTGGQVIS